MKEGVIIQERLQLGNRIPEREKAVQRIEKSCFDGSFRKSEVEKVSLPELYIIITLCAKSDGWSFTHGCVVWHIPKRLISASLEVTWLCRNRLVEHSSYCDQIKGKGSFRHLLVDLASVITWPLCVLTKATAFIIHLKQIDMNPFKKPLSRMKNASTRKGLTS